MLKHIDPKTHKFFQTKKKACAETIEAVRYIVGDWDGTNRDALTAPLLRIGLRLDEINGLSEFQIRMHFDTVRPFLLSQCGVADTATHTVTKMINNPQDAPQATAGDASAGRFAQPGFPVPSKPISKKTAVGEWGGSMTVDKLTSLMKKGRVRYLELDRQMFIFCCDDVPNLEPSHKNQD